MFMGTAESGGIPGPRSVALWHHPSSPIRVPEAFKDIRRCWPGRPARRRWEDRGQWPNHSVTRDMIALSKASSE